MILKYLVCLTAIVSLVRGLPLSNYETDLNNGLNQTKVVTLFEAIISSLEALRDYLGIDPRSSHDHTIDQTTDQQENIKEVFTFKSISEAIMSADNNEETEVSSNLEKSEPQQQIGVRLFAESEENAKKEKMTTEKIEETKTPNNSFSLLSSTDKSNGSHDEKSVTENAISSTTQKTEEDIVGSKISETPSEENNKENSDKESKLGNRIENNSDEAKTSTGGNSVDSETTTPIKTENKNVEATDSKPDSEKTYIGESDKIDDTEKEEEDIDDTLKTDSEDISSDSSSEHTSSDTSLEDISDDSGSEENSAESSSEENGVEVFMREAAKLLDPSETSDENAEQNSDSSDSLQSGEYIPSLITRLAINESEIEQTSDQHQLADDITGTENSDKIREVTTTNNNSPNKESSTENPLISSAELSTLIVYEVVRSGENDKALLPNETNTKMSSSNTNITENVLRPRIFGEESESVDENSDSETTTGYSSEEHVPTNKSIDGNLKVELSHLFQNIIKNISMNATNFKSLTVQDVSNTMKRMMQSHYAHNISSNDSKIRISSSGDSDSVNANLGGVDYEDLEDFDIDALIDKWLEMVLNTSQIDNAEVKFVDAFLLPKDVVNEQTDTNEKVKKHGDYRELTDLFGQILTDLYGYNDTENDYKFMNNGTYLGSRMSLNTLEDMQLPSNMSTRWSFKEFFYNIFGWGGDDDSSEPEKERQEPDLNVVSTESPECKPGNNTQQEMFAVIPAKRSSPSLVTLIWHEEKCDENPSELQVDVFGTSFDASANVYMVNKEHVCGAVTELPEGAWLLANVDLIGNSGSTKIPWPKVTVTQLMSDSHVLVKNVKSGLFLCGTLVAAQLDEDY